MMKPVGKHKSPAIKTEQTSIYITLWSKYNLYIINENNSKGILGAISESADTVTDGV